MLRSCVTADKVAIISTGTIFTPLVCTIQSYFCNVMSVTLG
jgi:hypothetical protein